MLELLVCRVDEHLLEAGVLEILKPEDVKHCHRPLCVIVVVVV
jgi:hypothetical protein